MSKVAVTVIAVLSTLVAADALACGGAPPSPSPTGGRAGTAVVEAGGSVSIFTATQTGYSWDRVQLPSTERTHVGDIQGDLTGSVETDARVSTAIASVYGQVVQLDAANTIAVGAGPEAQTTVFGAALSSALKWQVFTYLPGTQRVTYFAEDSTGVFAQVTTVSADCGAATMLDVVAEDDGHLFALCGGTVLELQGDTLALSELPLPASALAKGADGHAVAYGVAANGTDVVAMAHGTSGWSISSTLAGSAAPQVMFALGDSSLLVLRGDGYTAYTRSNDGWVTSAPLDRNTAFSSAGGSPARVLSGQYQLTLHSTDGSANGAWTDTDLGAMGIAPVAPTGMTENPASFGCTIVGTGLPAALLAALTLARMKRRQRRG